MHPPFPFRLRRKGNGPCTVQRKRRFGAKRHGVPYLLMIRGSQRETLGGQIRVSVGRRLPSSQSPYPSLPAYAESSLIPMLVLSPRKPLRWVFAGAPVLLNLSGPQPATDCLRAPGCKTDLTCFFPPLPLCRPRIGLSQFPAPAALSAAESAERDAGQIRPPPRKKHPRPQMRGSTSLFPKTKAHPSTSLRLPPHRPHRPPFAQT